MREMAVALPGSALGSRKLGVGVALGSCSAAAAGELGDGDNSAFAEALGSEAVELSAVVQPASAATMTSTAAVGRSGSTSRL